MADSAAQLAREIADLKRRLAAVERSSQLGRSSVDAGTLIVNDDDGQPVLAIGRQEDGTYAVVGANGGKVVADTVPQEVLDELAAQLELADGAVTEAKLAAEAVTTTKIADDAITTPKIVAGAVQAGQIAAGAVVAGKLATNSVLANNITANAVTADKIEAGSITADRLGVGTIGGELVPDGSFESADMRAQRAGGSWTFDTGSAAPRSHGDAFAQVAGSTTTFKQLILTDQFDVQPGEKYTGSFNYRGTSGTDGLVQLQMEVILQDGSKAFPQVGGQGTVADGTWRSLRNTVTMPANAVSAHIYLQSQNQTTGMWCADAVSVRRVLGGVEIGDGAVTADKLSADAITGKTITGSTLIIDDIPGGGSVEIDGESGEFVLTGTDGKVVKLVPSNVNPEIRFYSKQGNTFAYINQPATVDPHASLGMNSGGYIPTDGTNRVLRLWLNSQSDTGQLECIRKVDQERMGGYVRFTSGELLLGRFDDVDDVDTYLRFTGNDILLNADGGKTRLFSGSAESTTVDAYAPDFVSTASSSYTALSGNPGVVFVAPPSDKVMVHISSAIAGSGSTSKSRMSFEIRQGATIGSGTVVKSAIDEYSIAIDGPNGTEFGRGTLIWGLTPGATYNVRCLYRNDGGSGNSAGFARRKVVVVPLFA